MAEENPTDNRVTYNAAEEIKNNIVQYFRQASLCMMSLNFYGWYKSLESAYMEAEFKFTVPETSSLKNLWKSINPNNPKCFDALKEYHTKLRRICYEHDFFTPPKIDAGSAIFRR